MGDRHKNFEDPSTWDRDIRKTKFDPFLIEHPLYETELYQVKQKACQTLGM